VTQKAFADLQTAANAVLAHISSDVKMALASNSQPVKGATKQGTSEEVKRKRELSDQIKTLKAYHEQLLAVIAAL